MSHSNLREWELCLGTRGADDTADQVMRLVHRIDDAVEAVSYVLRVTAGGPSEEAEEALRIGRRTIVEAFEVLELEAKALRSSDHYVA